MIAIDDVWISAKVQLISWQRGELGGSDHYPVIVDLAVPRRDQ
jgi:hypothetical protein